MKSSMLTQIRGRAQCEASLVAPDLRGNFLPFLMFSPIRGALWALTALDKCHLKTDGVKEVLILYLAGGGQGGVGLPIFLPLLPGGSLDSLWCYPYDPWIWSDEPSVMTSGAGSPQLSDLIPWPRKV